MSRPRSIRILRSTSDPDPLNDFVDHRCGSVPSLHPTCRVVRSTVQRHQRSSRPPGARGQSTREREQALEETTTGQERTPQRLPIPAAVLNAVRSSDHVRLAPVVAKLEPWESAASVVPRAATLDVSTVVGIVCAQVECPQCRSPAARSTAIVRRRILVSRKNEMRRAYSTSQANLLFPRKRVPPRHLSKASQSGPHRQPHALLGRVSAHLITKRWARPDDRHLTAQHIDQLRKLVDTQSRSTLPTGVTRA